MCLEPIPAQANLAVTAASGDSSHPHWWLPSPAQEHGHPVFWADWELQSDTPWSDPQPVRNENSWTSDGKALRGVVGHPPWSPGGTEHHLPTEGSCSLAFIISSLPHSLIMGSPQINPCIQILISESEEPKPRQSKWGFLLLGISQLLCNPISQQSIWRDLGQWHLTDWVQIPTLPLTSGASKLIPLSGPPSPHQKSNTYLIGLLGRILAQSRFNLYSFLLAGWSFLKRSINR